MTLTIDDINSIRNITREVITEALVPIISRLDNLEGRFDNLVGRFDNLEGRFDNLEERFDSLETSFRSVDNKLRIIDTKLLNASNSRNDRLSIVPLPDGSNPICEYPESLCNLIVSGTELLPGKDTVNNWNNSLLVCYFVEIQ
jgi:hypothetical protein